MGETAAESADVYSLGALLYRLLAGEVPFVAETPEEATRKFIEEPPPPMSSFREDFQPDLERVILTAMAKNPEMRYQTVSEFSGELSRFAGDAEMAAAAAPKHDIWKTAFVVLAGISLLAVAFIYATSVKQTNPTTRLQPDANGQPVQPINPATGIPEQNLASMPGMVEMSNTNMAVPPGTVPGGDGYDPWKNGGRPPVGAPLGPGGQVVTIDPNNPSPFMSNDGPCIPQPSGIVLCPVPANKAVKPTPTPKNPAANTNVQTVPGPTPTKPEVKTSPTVEKNPARPTRPTPTPPKPKNAEEDL
jgi:serine/threonine-protein kinase